jgi:hypothetical protein
MGKNKCIGHRCVEPKPSRQMQALMMIADDPEIGQVLLSILDVQRDEVRWQDLNYGVLSGGQKATLSWAWAIWTDSSPPAHWRDPFEGFGVMSVSLQTAVLKALVHRHSNEPTSTG